MMRPPATIVGLLRASHLSPALAVTAIAAALSVSVGRGRGTVVVVLAVGAGQLAVGWSNDYLDRENDRRAGRLDKPIVAGRIDAATVRSAAVVALVACVPFSFLSGWRAGAVHIAAVAAALAYNRALKATLASVVPYAVAFGLLPVFVTLGLPRHPLPPAWAIAAAGLFGCGAHFLNTLGDIDGDLRLGIRGLPQRVGSAASLAVGGSLLAIATVILTFAPRGGANSVVLALFVVEMALVVGVVVAAISGHLAVAWPLTLLAALIAVTLLLANGQSLA